MTRDLRKLGSGSYDLLVIGGGIHGACAAWDAVLRGLSVALLDKGDFGAATSANSLKIIHGGLRYLQHVDLRRVRESIVECAIFLRIAPHLVRPLPVLVPTYGHGMDGREALAVALRITDLIGFDRNRHLPADRRIMRGRTLSRAECLARFGGFETGGLTGGALWCDAQAIDSERLTLAFVLSAAARGAVLANYVRVERLLRSGQAVAGAGVVDALTGESFEIRARVTLNATGPWLDEIVGRARVAASPGEAPPHPPPMALGLNLVTRPVVDGVAVGLRSKAGRDRDPVGGGGRFLFLAPWRRRTLVGTAYRIFRGAADDCRVSEGDLQRLLDQVNEACPALRLALEDVTFYHRGLLPLRRAGERGRPDSLADRPRIHDHEAEDGLRGLVSAEGVKYTTARRVARDAIDLVVTKLGGKVGASRTAEVPLDGAEDVVAAVGEPGCREPVAPGAEVRQGEVLHAVRSEMAVKLADAVLRRTGMGAEGCPPPAHLDAAAELMAGELGWDDKRKAAEIAEVRESYAPLPVR